MPSHFPRGCLVALCALTLAPAIAADVEEKAVLGSFQGFLDGLGQRDKATMMAHVLEGGSATLMREGKPVQMSLETLADKLSQPGKDGHEERIHDALVKVDRDVAIVWAPFEFLLSGKVDHCGRDIATLVKVEGRWLIAYIEDNGRKDCGAETHASH
jgi:hypothetical protein